MLWQLYEAYEELLELDSPIDPDIEINNGGSDRLEKSEIAMAVIESVSRLDVFDANILIERQRVVPPNPQINVNLSLNLQPGLDPSQIAPDTAAAVQNLLNDASTHLAQIVQQEIARQSPVAGISMRLYGGRWRNRTGEPI